jgi:hypothetical protein
MRTNDWASYTAEGPFCAFCYLLYIFFFFIIKLRTMIYRAQFGEYKKIHQNLDTIKFHSRETRGLLDSELP